jgi:hypothetical protein
MPLNEIYKDILDSPIELSNVKSLELASKLIALYYFFEFIQNTRAHLLAKQLETDLKTNKPFTDAYFQELYSNYEKQKLNNRLEKLSIENTVKSKNKHIQHIKKSLLNILYILIHSSFLVFLLFHQPRWIVTMLFAHFLLKI